MLYHITVKNMSNKHLINKCKPFKDIRNILDVRNYYLHHYSDLLKYIQGIKADNEIIKIKSYKNVIDKDCYSINIYYELQNKMQVSIYVLYHKTNKKIKGFNCL